MKGPKVIKQLCTLKVQLFLNDNTCQIEAREMNSISYEGNNITLRRIITFLNYIYHIAIQFSILEYDAMPNFRLIFLKSALRIDSPRYNVSSGSLFKIEKLSKCKYSD